MSATDPTPPPGASRRPVWRFDLKAGDVLLQIRPDRNDRFWGRALARALKRLLRAYGLTCVDAREVPPQSPPLK